MKNFKILCSAVLCLGLFSVQNIASGQAQKNVMVEYHHEWFCPCVGEYLVATLTSVGVFNANGQHWRTTGTAVGYVEEGGEATGNIFDVKNVENYIFKLRDNGSYNPDKGVWTMQIRQNGKIVALTHPSYEIKYNSDGSFKEIVWSGFWCSPN